MTNGTDADTMARAMGMDYEPPHERLKPNIHTEGDAYIVEFPGAGVAFEVTRVEASRSEIYGVIRVTSNLPGVPTLLHQGRFNLTGTSARSALVKYLERRCEISDWSEVVEQVCFLVLDTMREGQPVVRITDVAPREQQSRFRIAPLVVEGFPTIIFGPGGAGKSQLAAMLAMAVHGDDGKGWNVCDLVVEPGPVLVCDWELDAVTYREVCDPIAVGLGIPLSNFHYRQCTAPLYEEAAAIGRFIAREGIAMVVVDSLGYAIGGDKTSQELTMRMFGAIRGWGCTALCIDHITNDESNGDRPYGSVYTINSARALWRVRAAQEEGSSELNIGLFQTKANFGKQPPVGFLFRFSDGATSIERQDVRQVGEFRDTVSLSMRIRTALLEARRALNVAEIIELAGIDEKKAKQVPVRLSQMVKNGQLTKLIAEGVQAAARYALATDREEP